MRIALTLVAALVSWRASAATDVMFFVDAEDYTANASMDALRDLVAVFNESAVKAEINVVGYLARQLRQQERSDVFRELRPHVIGSHTLYLAKRPTVAEYTDIPDAAQAYRLAMAEESLSLGLIRTAFGLRKIELYAPAGADSYVAMYAAADAGMKFCVGARFATPPADAPAPTVPHSSFFIPHSCFWYCGLLQLPVLNQGVFQLPDLMTSAAEPDYAAILDKLAARKFVGLRIETSWIANLQTWKELNFNPLQPTAFGEWKKNRPRPDKDVQRFYSRLRRLLARLQSDSRFRLVSLSDYEDLIAERRPVRRTDIPQIRARLLEKFGPVEDLELSLSDVYQATVDFLRGAEQFTPGQVRGFLKDPEGVSRPTTITAASLKAAADGLVDVDYVPVSIEVETETGDRVRIGPADFVLAALEVLETRKDKVKVAPRDQYGCVRLQPPPAPNRDKFLARRLLLQVWTYRPVKP